MIASAGRITIAFGRAAVASAANSPATSHRSPSAISRAAAIAAIARPSEYGIENTNDGPRPVADAGPGAASPVGPTGRRGEGDGQHREPRAGVGAQRDQQRVAQHGPSDTLLQAPRGKSDDGDGRAGTRRCGPYAG